MTKDERLDRQRQLNAIDRRIAELFAERARINDELTEDKVDVTTGKRPPRRKPVQYAEISNLDSARAGKLLTDLENRRRARA